MILGRLRRLRRLWELSEEPYDIIGGQLSDKQPEIIHPLHLAAEQKARFVPYEKRDIIKEITEEQP